MTTSFGLGACRVVLDVTATSNNLVKIIKYGRCPFLLQMFMDLVLEGLLREHLMVAPLLVVVGITEQLVTMGAEDFKVWSTRVWSKLQRRCHRNTALGSSTSLRCTALLPLKLFRVVDSFGTPDICTTGFRGVVLRGAVRDDAREVVPRSWCQRGACCVVCLSRIERGMDGHLSVSVFFQKIATYHNTH